MAGATASLAVLGYDPVRFHGSCSAFEAVARGLVLEPGDVAFRLDLVTLERREDGMLVMGDVAGGRPSTVDARILLEDVTRAIAGDGIEVHPGVGYRHLLVWRGGEQGTQTTPPRLIAGEPVAPALPNGPGAERLRAMMDRAGDVLRAHPLCAARRARGEGAPNAIWPWGEGGRRTLPAMRDRFGVEGAVIAAADLVRGLGKLAGLRVVDVPGGDGRAALQSARGGRQRAPGPRRARLPPAARRGARRRRHRATRSGRSRPSSASTRSCSARCSRGCGRAGASGG